MEETVADKVVKDISKDFMVRGNHRIHHWYAYAIIGVVLGMAGVMLYIANQNGQFEASQAAKPRGTAIVNRPGAMVNAEKSTLAIYKVLAEEYKREHGNKLPEKMIVRTAEFNDSAVEMGDTFALGASRVFMTATPQGVKQLEDYLSQFTSLNKLADVIFGSTVKAQGYVIVPNNLAKGTDFAATLSASGQIINAPPNVATVTKNLCSYDFTGDFTIGGESYHVTLFPKDKSAYSCTPGADGDKSCQGEAGSMYASGAYYRAAQAAIIAHDKENPNGKYYPEDEISGTAKNVINKSKCATNGVAI